MINVSFCRLGRIIPEPFAGYVLPYVRKQIARTDDAVPCTVLGAMWNGLACAAAVAVWNEDAGSGELRSLFVDPKARGCGIAGRLIDFLLEEAMNRGMESLVFDYILNGEELAAMDALVTRRGGTIENGAPICGILSEDFLGSPLLGPALRPGWKRDSHVLLFSELTVHQRAALDAAAVQLPAFLRPASLGERLDPGLSAVYLADGAPVAFVLGFQSGDRSFCQSSIWRGPDAPEGSFRSLICTQVNQCWYRSGGNFVFFISPISPRSAAIAEWFTGGNYEPYTQRDALIPIRTDI